MNLTKNILIHGDCLEIMKQIPNKSIDMVCCDPPYGTSGCKWDVMIPLKPMWEHLKRIIKPNGAIVLMAIQPFTTILIASNMEMFKYCWVWNKVTPVGYVIAKLRPMQQHEDICVFSYGSTATGGKNNIIYNPQGLIYFNKVVNTARKKGINHQNQYRRSSHKKYHFQEWTNYPKTIINFNKPLKSVHPTQKPVELMKYLIKTYTNESGMILDFCMGSGTSCVAAKELNRKFIGIELDKNYFEIAKNRIESTQCDKVSKQLLDEFF